MSESLQQIIGKLLGVPSAASAEGAEWQLDSAWSWAPWATLLLIVAAALATVLLYARESGNAERWYRAILIALRCVVWSVVLVMIAQWALVLRITGPPSLALVVDRSGSMHIADRYGEAELPAQLRGQLSTDGTREVTRLDLAKHFITANDGQLLEGLTGRYRLETYFVAGGIERLPTGATRDEIQRSVERLSAEGPDSQSSRLGDVLRQVLADSRAVPPAAFVLLTDGVTTEGVPLTDAAEEARQRGVPVFSVGLGSDVPPRDIEVSDVLVDEMVFVNELVSLQAHVKASGLAGKLAKVILKREPSGKTVNEQSVSLPANGQTLHVQLVDTPTQAGQYTYSVEIAPRDDERDQHNNVQKRTVTVVDQKIRVLLVEGYPSYEFRFLKTLLERDRTIELSTFLQDADPDYAEQDRTALRNMPVSREDLFEYDVAIIGDVDPRLLPRSLWQSLRAFVVEKGGGAALIAGPRFIPQMLSDHLDAAVLLPMELPPTAVTGLSGLPAAVTNGFQVRPTPLGLQSPAFQLAGTAADSERIWQELAPLYWLYEIEKLKPAAQVLADGASMPVIVFQYVGAGRVLFHAVDSTWRWRIGAGDASFARYWVQTIRFLARGKLAGRQGARLTTDRREYQRGDPVTVHARFFDSRLAPAGETVTVLVDSGRNERRRVTLRRNPSVDGLFEGTVADLTPGGYEVSLLDAQTSAGTSIARFTVTAPPGEMARTEMDSTTLAAAAERTGGKFYRVSEAKNLLADLPAGRRVPVENLPPVAIWNRWWLLATFVAAITTEWIMRKRKGML